MKRTNHQQTDKEAGRRKACPISAALAQAGMPITSGSEEFIEIANWHAFQIIPDLKVQ
jgi:hypothetical protein